MQIIVVLVMEQMIEGPVWGKRGKDIILFWKLSSKESGWGAQKCDRFHGTFLWWLPY